MGKAQKYKKPEPVEPVEELNPSDFASTDEEFGGFESSSDSDSDDEEQQAQEELEAVNQPSKKSKKRGADAEQETEKAKNGVVYVGRIPHGFDEKGMRKYFSQFGDILNLRLSRNKRTGSSKHYGFIEFETPEIADIVCDTMDGYLLFGHVLKVKRVEAANIQENLWAGSNKKYQAIPWSQIGKRRYDRKHSREWWEEHQKAALARKLQRSKNLKKLGIDYTY